MRSSLEQLKLVVQQMKKKEPDSTFEEVIEIIENAEDKAQAFLEECVYLIGVINRWIIQEDGTIYKLYYTDLVETLKSIIEKEVE